LDILAPSPNHKFNFNPDSAVEDEAQDKAQAFRSERNRPVPLSLVAGIGEMSRVLNGANEVPSNKKNFEPLRVDAFATPRLRLAQHKSYNKPRNSV